MFSSFLKIHNVLFSEKINMWIFYLSKVPLLGKIIPSSLYRSNKTKIILANIIRIFSFIFMFIKKYLYFLVMISIPAIFLAKEISGNESLIELQIFFFLSFILWPLIDNKFVVNLEKDFCMINLMRFDAKQYYLSTILFSYLKDFIVFFVVIKFLGASLLETFIRVFALMAFKIIIQSIYLLANKVIGFHPSTKPTIFLTILFVPVLLAYGLPLLGIVFDINLLFMNVYFMTLLLGIAIISLIYLITYKKYTILAKKILSKDDVEKIKNIATNATFNDVAINEEKIDSKNLKNDKYKDKEGIGYLNLKFIERHKKIMLSPVKKRIMTVLVLFVVTITLIIFTPKFNEVISESILTSTGVLVFILYITSIGEKTTKAFFFNCDNSLLRYSFYKDPRIILKNFKVRLKIVTLFNLMPAFTMAISLLIIMILTKGDLLRFIPVFISIITLSIFFTVHYLFLYYITQPYTVQLKIKNPIYQIASIIVYLLSWVSLQIRTANLEFTIGIILLTIIYIIVSLFLIYKYAHKTFRLK